MVSALVSISYSTFTLNLSTAGNFCSLIESFLVKLATGGLYREL